MEFIRPHAGALLVYDPTTKKVTLRPFGFAKALALTVKPDNMLVKSVHGHQVDSSDIGALLRRVSLLQKNGRTTILGTEKVKESRTLMVSVEGENSFALEGTHRILLNLDETTWLPLKVRAFDTAGNLLEEVLLDGLKTNVTFDDALFRP